MVSSLKRHLASEKRSLNYCLNNYDNVDQYADITVRRLKLEKSKKVLEIGAAQGSFLIALSKRGYDCEGIEPDDIALEIAQELSAKMRQPIKINKGFAESIPYNDASFDIVIAFGVMEHVHDIEKAFNEISRLLKPGGIFYFTSASAMCPVQNEIQYFPFFSWYPQRAKLWIMNWAKINKPALVGWSNTPAINWFTPWNTKRLLEKSGMKLQYDRWDIIEDNELNEIKCVLLKIIKLNKFTKLVGDILTPGCMYLATKN